MFVTGLIYVVIIALWAAVLIPIWLRRHDQISEVRSTARFSSAMTRLGSPDPRASDPRVPAPAPVPREAPMTLSTSRPPEGLDPDYERELIRQAAATRRAIVLGALTLILIVVLLLAVVGVLPRWAPLLAALPVVAFVAAAALTASERTSGRRSARTASPGRARHGDMSADRASVATAAVEDDWETWNAWDDDDSWEPVPTTLPTYVSAPKASAVPRGIDRAHDGEWSGEAMVETAQAMRGRPASSPMDPRHGHGQVDPRDIDHAAQTAEIPVVRVDDDRKAVNE